MKKSFYRWLILFLFCIFLTIGISPILSQIPSSNLIAQNQINPMDLLQESQADYETGNLVQAIEKLNQAVENFKQQQKWDYLAITYTNLGRLQLVAGQPEVALTTWQEAETLYKDKLNNNQKGLAIINIYQAEALQNLGNYSLACGRLINGLEIQIKDCETLAKDIDKDIATKKNINQEQAKNQESSQVIKQLNNLENLDSIKITGWRSLGDLLRSLGKLEESKLILEKLIEKISLDSQQLAATQLSLGNTLRAMGNLERDRHAATKYDYLPWQYNPEYNLSECSLQPNLFFCQELAQYYQQAENHYQQVISLSKSSENLPLLIKAKLNYLSLLIEQVKAGQKPTINLDNEDLIKEIESLPLSQNKIYSYLNYSKSLMILQQIKSERNQEENVIKYLTTALQDTEELLNKNLINQETKSYILGNLGSFYEYQAWWLNQAQQTSLKQTEKDSLNLCQSVADCRQKAYEFTQKALYLAQPSDTPHLAYQWQWQLGRLLENEGKREEAIAYYQAAIDTLKSVRSDLLVINSDVQFNFRDNIEPVYRGLVNLLVTTKADSDLIKNNLKNAIENIDNLQLAELSNFLNCNLSINEKALEKDQFNDSTAVIIYPIILKDRLSIIFKIPGKEESLDYRETIITSKEVEKNLKDLRNNLIESDNTPEVIAQAQTVYQWLIKPLDSFLNNQPEIKTLVFVLDGVLRNIPMAVLYDCQNYDNTKKQCNQGQYLLEKNYNIAVVPGLNLVSFQQSPGKLKVFTGGVGLAQPELGFQEKIKNLTEELNGISQEVTTSEPLLNEDFKIINIQQQLETENFTAIHWKTHGKFSSDPENNFIVAYKEKINSNELNQLIQTGSKYKTKPLELLVLSACETATGDNRAVLGLAGIAVRSGARSTLSTLWRADDIANTKLMIKFYQELSKQTMTKAQALHQAQLELFKEYSAPHIWATYILVGDWF